MKHSQNSKTKIRKRKKKANLKQKYKNCGNIKNKKNLKMRTSLRNKLNRKIKSFRKNINKKEKCSKQKKNTKRRTSKHNTNYKTFGVNRNTYLRYETIPDPNSNIATASSGVTLVPNPLYQSIDGPEEDTLYQSVILMLLLYVNK